MSDSFRSRSTSGIFSPPSPNPSREGITPGPARAGLTSLEVAKNGLVEPTDDRRDPLRPVRLRLSERDNPILQGSCLLAERIDRVQSFSGQVNPVCGGVSEFDQRLEGLRQLVVRTESSHRL